MTKGKNLQVKWNALELVLRKLGHCLFLFLVMILAPRLRLMDILGEPKIINEQDYFS